MFPFPPSKIFLFLTRDFLSIYSDKGEPREKFEFNKEFIAHLEILDKDKFQESLNNFFKKLNLAGKKAFLILSNEIVYEKVFERSQDLEQKVKTFLSKIPHFKEKIIYKLLDEKDKISIFATNSDLIEGVLEGAHLADFEVEKVIPINYFTDKKDLDSLGKKDLELLSKNKKQVDSLNFLEQKEVVYPEIKEEEKVIEEGKDQTVEVAKPTSLFFRHFSPFYFILIMLVIGGALGALAYFRLTFVPKNTAVESNTLKKVETNIEKKEGSPSAEVEEKDKSDIKIEVLNGTGLPGEAAKARDLLISLGYSDITTGNSDTLDNTKTLLRYSSNVPQELAKGILKELKNNYQEEVIDLEEDLGDFDIQITTGK